MGQLIGVDPGRQRFSPAAAAARDDATAGLSARSAKTTPSGSRSWRSRAKRASASTTPRCARDTSRPTAGRVMRPCSCWIGLRSTSISWPGTGPGADGLVSLRGSRLARRRRRGRELLRDPPDGVAASVQFLPTGAQTVRGSSGPSGRPASLPGAEPVPRRRAFPRRT